MWVNNKITMNQLKTLYHSTPIYIRQFINNMEEFLEYIKFSKDNKFKFICDKCDKMKDKIIPLPQYYSSVATFIKYYEP